jgi:hypothetical protein
LASSDTHTLILASSVKTLPAITEGLHYRRVGV